MNKKILKLLYRSFDTKLSKEEEQILSENLEKSEELRLEKQHLATIRKEISQTSEYSFQPFFVEKVMNRIGALDENVRELDQIGELFTFIFRRVAVAGVLLAIALIMYNLLGADSISVTEVFGIPETTIEDVIDPLFLFNL